MWPVRCGKFVHVLLCAGNGVRIFETRLHRVVVILRTTLVELRCGQHADSSSATRLRNPTVRDWTCVIKTNEILFLDFKLSPCSECCMLSSG